MAPFSLPAPCIIALRLPMFGGPKSIDTNTKVQLLCETQLDYEIWYTLDGTKPQPYAGIVQGNKTIKYSTPICLPAGKITIKAIAINANVHTMCSSVVTKCYEVLKVESTEELKQSAKKKQSKNNNGKKKDVILDSRKVNCDDDGICDSVHEKFDSFSVSNNGTNCFEEAFIGGSEFETVLSDVEDSVEDQSGFPTAAFDDDISYNSGEESEDSKSLDNVDENDAVENVEKDFAPETKGIITLNEENNTVEPDITTTGNSGISVETQFCCIKCDMTLQHCSSCSRMNAVSSKYCIECGKQLTRICFFCKEHNPSVATFCQYCGKKLNLNIQIDSVSKVDHSVMAKPQLKNVSIQELPVLMDKCTQTINEGSPVKKTPQKFQMRRLPNHSPGRGYWHQQLDYICNHLKSHAYNHLEFRKEISEPTLCDFKSAHIMKEEDNVTVTIIFSPLVTDKNGFSASEEIKSKGST